MKILRQPTSIFILAHQDDESGCFYLIEKKISLGNRVIILYLTSGTLSGKNSLKRNSESLRTLKKLGVIQKNIIFLSEYIASPDGKLPQYLDVVFKEVLDRLKNFSNIHDLYFLAWEGGHQDHDATHLIGVALAKKFKIIKRSYQFPLYTGFGLYGSLFRLFKAISSNGKPLLINIPFFYRIKYIRLSLGYPSQFRTWIGLFPFFLLHFIFFGTQILQPISLSRVRQKPHKGMLFYERRFSYKYESFCKYSSNFIRKYI